MMPHLNKRLRELSRRSRRLFDSINYVCRDDPAVVDELMVKANAEWQQIREEIEEILEVYPHLLAALEGRFQQEHPARKGSVAELIEFAYDHHLQLNGEPYRGPRTG
jgi:hypothetical protein